ncbi:MAG TPA: 50S ribosomal protein L25/general stress protein Ctc [Caulobacteraceae bacterium]|nr:50S ribosomal protein L25/general stress protein Ctc [Caulobacteraceae bacterium]
MADIVLNVEVRERTGTGAARSVRNGDRVPGILYGGPLGPVPVSAASAEFRKALYTGKLLGHLIKLKHGKDVQPVIAKAVQFHPVTDKPVHFDLFRVDEHAEIRIGVPVHFKNHEASPGLKRGGALNAVRHDIEVWAKADHIPEEIVIDLTGLDIGDAIRLSQVVLPQGVRAAETNLETVVASIGGRMAEDAEAPAEGAAPAEAAAAPAEAKSGDEG